MCPLDVTPQLKCGAGPAQLRDATLMLVDDEPIMLELVQHMLEGAGYRRFVLREAADGAIEAMRHQRPDLLLLDVLLPGVSGLELLRMVRADAEFAHLPVIILTSSSDAETKLEALDLGATDFLAKPVDPSELALRVRNTLAAKAYQDQLAFYDTVTRLPNARQLERRGQSVIDHARRHDRRVVMLHLAFGGFRRVVETFGPRVGEGLMRRVACRLRASLPEVASHGPDAPPVDGLAAEAYRLGADDFCVLLADVSDLADAALVGNRLFESMRQPFIVDDTEVGLAPAIGIAAYPGDGSGVSDLLRQAIGASSQAVLNGGQRLQFYSAESNRAALQRWHVEAGLRKAVAQRALRLFYQPKVEVATGRIVGTEALIRWSRDGGLIQPDDFIPVAEDTGLILDIGEWVLSEVCAQQAQWRATGIETRVAINVSARQFYESDLVGLVCSALDRHGVAPSALTLEVTESLLIANLECAERMLRRARDIGVRVSIDDFGIGYSSLSYLKRLPVDEVKLDRSFLVDVAKSAGDQALVAAIIQLAHTVGYTVCAEGVEQQFQLDLLRDLGCEHYQGYLHSRPVAPDDVACLLAGHPA
jgi:diguanylate cyclase